jgi:hypothetical protein
MSAMVLRVVAITIAIAAAVDPAMARRVAVPLPVEVLMPAASDPLFERAVQVRQRIASTLGDRASLDSREAPQAFIALGRARLPEATPTPLFGMPLAQSPAVAIEQVSAPAAMLGQTVPIVATLRGIGVAGRTTTIAAVRDGTPIESIEHKWKSDDETFVARFAFVPAAAGVHRLRIGATTSGLEDRSNADIAVAVRERRLRVLTFEPRPSWPLAFVRRSLEADPLFDVTTTARTTSRSATTTAGAPASLATLQADRFDAILVGAPEALTNAEIRALDTFVSTRGGALLLLPDRRFSDNLRSSFALPDLEEVVLERPLTTAPPGPAIRASELLLARDLGGLSAIAAVRHGRDDRVAVGSVARGAGRIIVSGALDAWRYRADPEVSFDGFWRSLVADAAADAPPRLTVRVDPSIARPGDDVLVTVTLRPTEFDDAAELVEVPSVKAELLGGEGSAALIRLWPGAAPGTFEGRTRAPRAGGYSASVSIPGVSADAPLLIAEDVVHAAAGSLRAATFAAAASGGAMVASVDELAQRLGALKPREVDQRTHPMRSPWWIVPFAVLLCAEWAVRRRGGRR